MNVSMPLVKVRILVRARELMRPLAADRVAHSAGAREFGHGHPPDSANILTAAVPFV